MKSVLIGFAAALLVITLSLAGTFLYFWLRPPGTSPMVALAEYARTHDDLMDVLAHAADTPYTELRFEPFPPADQVQQDANGVPTVEATIWMHEHTRSVAIAGAAAALGDFREGTAVLSRPDDHPFADDRAFLRLKFKDGKITSVFEGYLD